MIEHILDRVTVWAAAQPDIVAVVLVGSHARGTASAGSDIDLMLLCQDPVSYLQNVSWTLTFGEPRAHSFENWGDVTAVRVHYLDGTEVEFGLAGSDWGSDPLDGGTAEVIRAGTKILFDRGLGLASRFQIAAESPPLGAAGPGWTDDQPPR